jgi:prepilin-type processing-associated H-X9-DG protein
MVELLVVIGIIAVLVTLLLPAYGRIKASAVSNECQSNMRQLYQACRAFSADNNGRIPRPSKVWDTPGNAGVKENCIWAMNSAGVANFDVGAIWKYMPNRAMRETAIQCPGDLGERTHYGGYQSGRNMSYSLHQHIVADDGGTLGSIRFAQVPRPADKIMIFEEIGPNDSFCVDLHVPDRWDDQPTARHGSSRVYGKDIDSNRNADRKIGKGNYCYFDGRVESYTPQQIYDNPSWSTDIFK